MFPTFTAIEEARPGPAWQALWAEREEAYRAWFLQDGDAARPSYLASARALRTHMPELVPVWERLVELAGGGDLAARLLSLWRPPPFLAACSQAVWTEGAPVLVRNYDYDPALFEAVVPSTAWTGRRVIGTSDVLWGLLDGMNDAGLAVSLTFGGRPVVGEGFGVPLVVRYLLEVCETVEEAAAVLRRVPVHQAHNLTLVDRTGGVLTAHLAPDREAGLTAAPVATNHQSEVEWHAHARATRTVEREAYLYGLLDDPLTTPDTLADAFLRPPLRATRFANGFGTLYTAAYRPAEGRLDLLWPGSRWAASFAGFPAGTFTPALEPGLAARA